MEAESERLEAVPELDPGSAPTLPAGSPWTAERAAELRSKPAVDARRRDGV